MVSADFQKLLTPGARVPPDFFVQDFFSAKSSF